MGEGIRGGGLDGSGPALPHPTPAEESVSQPSTPANPTGTPAANFRYDDRSFLKAGPKAKFNANLAALRTLKTIQAEGNRAATPEEQAVLSKFVGWGNFPALFNEVHELPSGGRIYGGMERKPDEWAKERTALKDALTPQEWEAAKKSTLNAHYTNPDIVDAHWQMARRLGFAGGRFLETSAGIGYYLGMMPEDLAGKTRTTAIELDKGTGGLLEKLYPKANVKIQGFQEHNGPDDFYDLVASNVPFGGYKVHDPKYNRHQANIHDYFFLKSADKVRPGGLVMHITSAGTLDKLDPKIREHLAKSCDLVAAIRFPGDAHKENAGTSVVTDMVVLRKRLPGETPGDDSWTKTTTVPDPAGGTPIPINAYFAANPDQVLGTVDRTGSMYRGEAANVSKTHDYEERLKAAIGRLPEGVLKPRPSPASTRVAPENMPAPGQVKEGGYHAHGGEIFTSEKGELVKSNVPKTQGERIAGMLGIRDAVRKVINDQTSGQDATESRRKLNAVYDQFVRKQGPLNAAANKRAFSEDPDAPLLLSLEHFDPETKKATKADMFSKDTVRRVGKVEKACTVSEALGVSLHETGGLDLDHIAKLTGLHPDVVAQHLTDHGLGYQDPSEGWKPSDQYLSGNVRRKLANARAAAANDPKFAANVAALEKVQPEDVHHDDIEAKLGAPWVPPTDIQDFAAHLLNGDAGHFNIKYAPTTGWFADYTPKGERAHWSSKTANTVWGTQRANFIELLESSLNNAPIRVTDKDSDGKQVVNKEETDNAMAKAQEIKTAFKEWLWTDDDRRARLHRFYNDNFNNVRPINYDGSHQQFPGMNPALALRPHQSNFVWQVVTTGKGLAAHEVGTGKTYSMVAAAMELRRLGLAKKPAIACLKANIEGVTRDARHAYPGAKIISTSDFSGDAAARRKAISMMATGDYDLAILTHDNLDMLEMKPDTQGKYISEEIGELEAAISAAEAEDPRKGNSIVKKMEKSKANLEAKLLEALDRKHKDDVVHFEDTGIDHLFVDECHKYKSLPCYTKQQGLKGVPTSRSDRATAMQMRTRWLQENNGGRGVVFATGTPVANTMAELYNVQRYLQPEELKERGVHSFDAWASTFGDVQTKMEFTVAGEYKPVSRFARFTNIPELMQMVRQVMDVQQAQSLVNADGSPSVVRPPRKDKVHTAPKSAELSALMADLQKRAKELKGMPEKGADNMLAICTDGRKGALDMRLVEPDHDDNPDSKLNDCVRNVLDLSKKHPGQTQMIFSDIGVNPTPWGFSVYGDIIDKLVAGGIPRERIADFSNLEGAKKEAAVDGLNKGEILVALGSTDKLGTGVNAQNKLMAIHHLDVPWMPAQVEQRNGRGWRQGNKNTTGEIGIHSYVSEGSLDQTFWQIIGNKTRFIQQVIKPGQNVGRIADDTDTEQLTPDQLMAAASGDPRILEKIQVDDDVRNLEAARVRHEREQSRLRDSVAAHGRNLPHLLATAAEHRANHAAMLEKPDFELEIDGKKYDDRQEANDAFGQKIDTTPPDKFGQPVQIATYRGHPVYKRGENFYTVGKSGERYSHGPSVGSLEYVPRKMEGDAKNIDAQIAAAHEDIGKVKAAIGKPFAKAGDLTAKRERQKELEAMLSNKSLPEGYKEGDEVELANGRRVKVLSGRGDMVRVEFGGKETEIHKDELPPR